MAYMHPMLRKALLPAARGSMLLALTACGGDDSGSASAPIENPSLTINGTAATGKAIANGVIDAHCDGGSGSGRSDTDGRFSMQLAEGRLPCLLQVVINNGTPLRAWVDGDGVTASANLKPVSELLVARMAGLSGLKLDDYFEEFDGQAASAVTADQRQDARDVLAQLLEGIGIDAATVEQVLTGTLVAGGPGRTGNAADLALEAMSTRLARSGLTAGDLAQAMARSAPNASDTSWGSTALPAAELLMQPSASNCRPLRSGKYLLIETGPQGVGAAEPLSIDATTLTWQTADDSGSFVPNGACRFSSSDSDMVVSWAGVAVIRTEDAPGSNQGRLAVAFPRQRHLPAALTGEWNGIGFGPLGTGSAPLAQVFSLSIDALGRLVEIADCLITSGCTPRVTPSARQAVAAADGSLAWVDSGGAAPDTLHVYRSGSGEPMVIQQGADGSLALWTRKRTDVLPPADPEHPDPAPPGLLNQVAGLRSYAESMFVPLNPQWLAAPMSVSANQVSAFDRLNGRYQRVAVLDRETGVTRDETVALNQPAAGFKHRQPEMVQASDGSSSNVSEWVALGLGGMGLSALAFPATGGFGLAVTMLTAAP